MRCWKTADWILFQSLLHDLPPLPSLWNEARIEDECNLLHKSINKALDISCPKLIIKPAHKLPWWDFSLNKWRRNAHRAHIHYQKTLLIKTNTYLNVPNALTSVNVEKLKEIAGNSLSLAPTLKKILRYSLRLFNIKSILTP